MVRTLSVLNDEDLAEILTERTLVICKPETLIKGECAELLTPIERKLSYKPVLWKMFQFSKDSVTGFYKGVIDEFVPKDRKKVRESFMWLTKNPSVAVVYEGANCIHNVRKIIAGLPKHSIAGVDGLIITDTKFSGYKAQLEPINAPPGTIRGDYGIGSIAISNTVGRYLTNSIHSSENKEDYEREIGILMKHSHISIEDFFNYRKYNLEVSVGLLP